CWQLCISCSFFRLKYVLFLFVLALFSYLMLAFVLCAPADQSQSRSKRQAPHQELKANVLTSSLFDYQSSCFLSMLGSLKGIVTSGAAHSPMNLRLIAKVVTF